jgi:hypothetical protein
MPPEQRAQVERMTGSQIAMLRKMVNGGEMDVVTKVRAIRVNTGLAGAFPTATRAKPAASATPPSNGDPLVQSTTGASTQPLEEAQAACLQQKIDAAKKKKRAFGKFVNATAKDVEEAADAHGLSKADIESCRSPK